MRHPGLVVNPWFTARPCIRGFRGIPLTSCVCVYKRYACQYIGAADVLRGEAATTGCPQPVDNSKKGIIGRWGACVDEGFVAGA